MIAGANWWRANQMIMRHLVMRHFTRQTEIRYRSCDKAPSPSATWRRNYGLRDDDPP
jgi:hypothetical protein